MNTREEFVIANCMGWIGACCDLLIRIEREELRKVKRKQQRRLKRHSGNPWSDTRYHQLINKRHATRSLADEAAKLMKSAARHLHQLDAIIKESKSKRAEFKKEREYQRADETTRMIAKLSEMYGEVKKERNHFLEKTRSMNIIVADLNSRIRNCDARSRKWLPRRRLR